MANRKPAMLALFASLVGEPTPTVTALVMSQAVLDKLLAKASVAPRVDALVLFADAGIELRVEDDMDGRVDAIWSDGRRTRVSEVERA